MRIKQAITANIGKLGECAKFENEYIKQTYQRSDKWVIWKAQPTHICEPLGFMLAEDLIRELHYTIKLLRLFCLLRLFRLSL